jgi:ABC-type multidrug transport system, ATPase component
MEKISLCIRQQKYGSKVILQDINQLYDKSKIHGVLGKNGSGKTTLFHCMTGLIPYDGQRTIPNEISFGYLPAELYMYSMITGDEFLQFYVEAKGYRYDNKEKTQLNDFFGLPLNEYAETYSTGMLKKLYLLGLLLQHNELLLLDEPFNGLDFESSAFITALLQHLREEGKTIFVASHDLDHLFSYADTISVIQEKTLFYYNAPTQFQSIKESIKNEARQKVQTAMKGARGAASVDSEYKDFNPVERKPDCH